MGEVNGSLAAQCPVESVAAAAGGADVELGAGDCEQPITANAAVTSMAIATSRCLRIDSSSMMVFGAHPLGCWAVVATRVKTRLPVPATLHALVTTFTRC